IRCLSGAIAHRLLEMFVNSARYRFWILESDFRLAILACQFKVLGLTQLDYFSRVQPARNSPKSKKFIAGA
ncbi:MAG: hypothetical protein SNJ50_02800, partial [Cyanobacteriota bacterium]